MACFSNGSNKQSVVAVSRIHDARHFRQRTPSFRCRFAIAPCSPTDLPSSREERNGLPTRTERATKNNKRSSRFFPPVHIYENSLREDDDQPTIDRVMASKTPKKRARIDAAAKDSTSPPSALDVSPSRRLPSQSSDVTACPKVRHEIFQSVC